MRPSHLRAMIVDLAVAILVAYGILAVAVALV